MTMKAVLSQSMKARHQDGRECSLLVNVCGSTLVISIDGKSVVVRGEDCWRIQNLAGIAKQMAKRRAFEGDGEGL
jgi:hypothetical protein